MKLGTDPEFFIWDTLKKKAVSASEVFPGKNEPWRPPYEDINDNGSYIWKSVGFNPKIFRDGFGVELNLSPFHCRETLTQGVNLALVDIKKKVKGHNKNWTIISDPTVEVSQEYLDSLPEDVKMFGCDPAFNAYLEAEERVELNGAFHHLRYAGGHMHFGYDYGTYESLINPTLKERNQGDIFTLIRIFDLLIGLPLSLIFNDEKEFQRREFYGKAGEFRFQPHGIEYRVPSPRIWNHPLVASLAFGVGRNVIQNFFTWNEKWKSLLRERKSLVPDLIRAINKGEGGEDLLQHVTYFYDKGTIDYLRGEGKETFKLMELGLGSLNVAPATGLEKSLFRVMKEHLIPRDDTPRVAAG